MSQWPINPNFPNAFSFPACGTREWIAFSLWPEYQGNADRVATGAEFNWQELWYDIVVDYFQDLTRPMLSLRDTTRYRSTNPGRWVSTLLDADKFWWDVSGWALECVEREFRILERDSILRGGLPPKLAEKACQRFHGYQQARYRYHEHLLEKDCERALGEHPHGKKPKGYIPRTGTEAHACLVGGLSRQRGFAKNPMVGEFLRQVRTQKSTPSLGEKKAFCAERTNPSKRPWRADADEVGWLILTWPIWNFHGWRFVEVSYALRKKFRVKDQKGKPLDFLAGNRKRMIKEIRSQLDGNGNMPAERAVASFAKHLFAETAEEHDWQKSERRRSDDRAIEQLCRDVVCLPISPRPKGRAPAWNEEKRPALWDFAYGICA